jgi:hypothetical protein
VRRLLSDGDSIGSHSIIHSRGFNKFGLGSGGEEFPVYHPLGTGFDTATGATVFGEVRVSKLIFSGPDICAFLPRCPRRCSAAAIVSIPLLPPMTS